MTKPDLIEIVKKRLEVTLAGSSAGSEFAPKKSERLTAAPSSAEEQVLTNGAIKRYIHHFDESCVHVGGLGAGQEEDDELEEFFSQFGTVYGATVRVREGVNRSWGLVSFASQDQAFAQQDGHGKTLIEQTRWSQRLISNQ